MVYVVKSFVANNIKWPDFKLPFILVV